MPGMHLPANQEQIPTWAHEMDREMMQRPQTLQVPMAEKNKARNAFGDLSTTASSATRGDLSSSFSFTGSNSVLDEDRVERTHRLAEFVIQLGQAEPFPWKQEGERGVMSCSSSICSFSDLKMSFWRRQASDCEIDVAMADFRSTTASEDDVADLRGLESDEEDERRWSPALMKALREPTALRRAEVS
mmetsp:Transcript_66697/g.156350  ORF Transcript_66697/g.156350 Transcript_66697/m.156350 type:complete len:188 (+) Transcript_66697:72-635(+)